MYCHHVIPCIAGVVKLQVVEVHGGSRRRLAHNTEEGEELEMEEGEEVWVGTIYLDLYPDTGGAGPTQHYPFTTVMRCAPVCVCVCVCALEGGAQQCVCACGRGGGRIVCACVMVVCGGGGGTIQCVC